MLPKSEVGAAKDNRDDVLLLSNGPRSIFRLDGKLWKILGEFPLRSGDIRKVYFLDMTVSTVTFGSKLVIKYYNITSNAFPVLKYVLTFLNFG